MTAIAAAMILAAALWWIYFDSTAEVNLAVLQLSGGSPTIRTATCAPSSPGSPLRRGAASPSPPGSSPW